MKFEQMFEIKIYLFHLSFFSFQHTLTLLSLLNVWPSFFLIVTTYVFIYEYTFLNI